ncbi:MAG: hypothetical protein HY666_01085 [Chloroflexi bacterium]|nr:hypothetical protein [Chloroflexota bacterium]
MAPRSRPKVIEPGVFYRQVLSQAQRIKLDEARQVEGLDEEIALLRVHLSQLVQEQPDKLELLLKGIRLLVHAVAVRYRLSPQAEQDLSKSLANVIREVGGLLMPEESSGDR